MIQNNSYHYMKDLLGLNSHQNGRCHAAFSHPWKLPLEELTVDVSVWKKELSSHPDQQFANLIIAGLEEGFRIGFNRSHVIHPASSNLRIHNPQIVSEYLAREVALNRMWKFPAKIAPSGTHISPMGIIPKKNKPNKWRLIIDLSSPNGFSINEGISPELSSLSYVSLEHLSSLVLAAGKEAWLVKEDIKEAYQMIPIHPQDWHLLGVHWEDSVYIDKRLPFRL